MLSYEYTAKATKILALLSFYYRCTDGADCQAFMWS